MSVPKDVGQEETGSQSLVSLLHGSPPTWLSAVAILQTAKWVSISLLHRNWYAKRRRSQNFVGDTSCSAERDVVFEKTGVRLLPTCSRLLLAHNNGLGGQFVVPLQEKRMLPRNVLQTNKIFREKRNSAASICPRCFCIFFFLSTLATHIMKTTKARKFKYFVRILHQDN